MATALKMDATADGAHKFSTVTSPYRAVYGTHCLLPRWDVGFESRPWPVCVS